MKLGQGHAFLLFVGFHINVNKDKILHKAPN